MLSISIYHLLNLDNFHLSILYVIIVIYLLMMYKLRDIFYSYINRYNNKDVSLIIQLIILKVLLLRIMYLKSFNNKINRLK